MHIPGHFEETNLAAKQQLIASQPLGTFITHSANGLNANHIPFVYHDSPGPLGSLQAHIPRINALLEDIQEQAEVLVIFHGPNGYISPSWYATKRETGKVVPTWNYSVVHAYGEARIIDDAAWVRRQMQALTDAQEASFAEPWSVDDAPAEFTGRMIKSLVGVEVSISRLLAKTKASQNQVAANQSGVIRGLEESGSDSARALAELVSQRGDESP